MINKLYSLLERYRAKRAYKNAMSNISAKVMEGDCSYYQVEVLLNIRYTEGNTALETWYNIVDYVVDLAVSASQPPNRYKEEQLLEISDILVRSLSKYQLYNVLRYWSDEVNKRLPKGE